MVKPPLPDQFSTYKQWCVALAKQGKSARDIKTETGCSDSYVYDALKIVRDEAEALGSKPTPTKVGIEEVTTEEEELPPEEPEEVEEVEEVEDIEVEEGEIPEIPAYAKSLMTGIVDADDCTGLWNNVNDLFPEEDRRPETSIRALGKLSVRPFTRIIVQYAGEWGDLIFLIIVACLTFAPSLKAVGGRWMAQRGKPKKKEKT